jgi:predicted nucleotidyltransferase
MGLPVIEGGGKMMITFRDLCALQSEENLKLKKLATELVQDKISGNNKILGALLTGSVARGDSRIGPFGIMIDLAIVVDKKVNIDLADLFGPDEEPYIPYHCTKMENGIGFGIEAVEREELYKIREKPESTIYAKWESVIIDDKLGILQEWKERYFLLSVDQIKERALSRYFRFQYMTNDYRVEKWEFRGAWLQLHHNMNEACNCFCEFLYIINGFFIPRNDWLVYLLSEMKIKPDALDEGLVILYSTGIITDKDSSSKRIGQFRKFFEWMDEYCRTKGWLG